MMFLRINIWIFNLLHVFNTTLASPYSRKYDIIVVKVYGKDIPVIDPQNYSANDVRKGVDGLYVAIHGTGAPKSGEMVTIGESQIKRRRRALISKLT